MGSLHVVRRLCALVGAVVLVGCTTVASPSGSATTSVSSAAAPRSPAIEASPPTSLTVAPPTVAPPMASTSARPNSSTRDAFLPGTTIETVVADVRIRSWPGVGADSRKLTPLLPEGSPLVVIGGPVAADGYDWYEVVPLAGTALPRGWLARASRDGEPWVAPAAFDCPTLPTDVVSLAALHEGVGYACFPGRPITLTARLVDCNCDEDVGFYQPEWFSGLGRALIFDGRVDYGPGDSSPYVGLYLDPAGTYPDPLPVGNFFDQDHPVQGDLVRVTGMFDHPAAASCTSTFLSPDGSGAPTGGCRSVFATTSVEVVE